MLLPYQQADDPSRPLKLFVSYRRKSWPFTHRLATDLEQRLNADISVDYSGLDETDFKRSIPRSILGYLHPSDGVLLVVS